MPSNFEETGAFVLRSVSLWDGCDFLRILAPREKTFVAIFMPIAFATSQTQ